MAPEEYSGWEEFAQFLLHRREYAPEVKKNGPMAGGVMYADGWRKCSKTDKAFGRFCSVVKLSKQMQKEQFHWVDEEEQIKKAGNWLSLKLRQLTPKVHEECHNLLKERKLPSLAHPEYGMDLQPEDFTSFLTYTMFNFYNSPHVDNNDLNTWTLVGWIPIFHPKHSSSNSEKVSSVLADNKFDMVGGQFVFRDSQVYLDFTQFPGITLTVFKNKGNRHQTLQGCSPSKKYTRIGFSCQISKTMADAIEGFLGSEGPKLPVSGQLAQIIKANERNSDQKKKKKQKVKKGDL